MSIKSTKQVIRNDRMAEAHKNEPNRQEVPARISQEAENPLSHDEIARLKATKRKSQMARWSRTSRAKRAPVPARIAADKAATQNASTEIIRNARIALAERVLSELSRSEEYRLSQGGDTTDDIKAERAKRREADPKAQRYAGRRVKKVKGKDSQGHGVYRRLAGTKVVRRDPAAQARANVEKDTYLRQESISFTEAGAVSDAGDADAEYDAAVKDKKRLEKVRAKGVPGGGKYTSTRPNIRAKVFDLRTSTEIVRNSRIALAEKVLSELKVEAGLKDEARARRKAKPKLSSFHAALDAKRARSDAKIKKAQGKNTPKSVFGGKSNQTSTTAGGGTLGSELAKTKPETQHSMNRKGTSTVDKKKVAANLADAKSGRNTASLAKEIAADNKKRAAKKRAKG